MPFDKSSTAMNTISQLKTMNNLEKISDANNLYDAFFLSKKGSAWKESTQKCEINLLKNIVSLREKLRTGTYKQKPFYEFFLTERGKTRPIRSQHITDRIVQRSLCDNVLNPLLSKYLIYDNGASLKDKGIMFTRMRLKAHLEQFLRKHETGYVLLIDFSKFFDNIPHDKFLSKIKEKFGDDLSLMPLITNMVNSFVNDVSYLSDEEYESDEFVFDSVRHRQRLSEYEGEKGLKILHRSLGIGSQMSQIGGLFYPSGIDNYFKCTKSIRYYGRYMDDIYIIHKDRNFLKKVLNNFLLQVKELGLFVNPNKICIVSLYHGFNYLKTNYKQLGNRIIIRANNISFVRERRRLKKFIELCRKDKMIPEEVVDSYFSWRGSIIRYANRGQNLKYTDKLFINLLKEVA